MRTASVNELNTFKQLLLEDKSDEALDYIKTLYKRYPSDYNVLFNLGSLLLKKKQNISDALFYLNLAKNSTNSDSINNEKGMYYLSIGDFMNAENYFSKINSNNEKSLGYKLNGLLKVYLHTEEYDRAYECCRSLKELHNLGLYDVEHLNNTFVFILKKLDRYNEKNCLHELPYYVKQTIEYSKERTIEHIEEHKLKNRCINQNDSLYNKRVHSLFNDDVNILDLYDDCTVYISDKHPDGYSYVDYYRMELPNIIGETYNGQLTNYIEIITFPNSKDILSIYPDNHKHVNKKVYLKEETPKKKKQDYRKKLKKKPKK